MKTAKEWLLEQLKEFPNHDEYDPKAVDAIADFMEHYAKYYHQQQVKSVDLADVVGSFCCKGCEHKLPLTFQMRTEGYCYLCDPNITLDECLSGAPLTK